MEWLEKGLDILSFCGTNKHILGICSLCGIIGFWFTICPLQVRLIPLQVTGRIGRCGARPCQGVGFL